MMTAHKELKERCTKAIHFSVRIQRIILTLTTVTCLDHLFYLIANCNYVCGYHCLQQQHYIVENTLIFVFVYFFAFVTAKLLGDL